jgi:nucleotide-binding universal stress UspA family protein
MMDELTERVAMAMREELGIEWPYTGHEQLLDVARAAIEAAGYDALESALVTIRSSIPGYLKKKMTAEDFALIVIGAVDNKAVNSALSKADALK